jgi:phosphatidylinositol glycan class B
MWMMYERYKKEISHKILTKWFLLLSFLLWFALYNAVRFSSETWSGALFIIGFSYLFLLKRIPGKIDYLLTGLIMGFSFLFRYQTGFLIAGYFLWFLVYRLILPKDAAFFPGERTPKKLIVWQLALLGLGIFAGIITGVLIDRWFYGSWVFTAWNYFEQNILADKVSGFGIEPWWFYFEDIFLRLIPPFSLVFILCALIVFIFLRNDLLTWTLLPFVLVHFIIGHKETRFLYPLVGFLPVLVIKGMEVMKGKWRENILERKFTRIFARTFWIVNCCFIFVVFFIPADSQVNIYKKIYRQYPEPVTLCYVSKNPYERALEISYYKRNNLSIRKLCSLAGLDSIAEKKYLFAVKGRDEEFDKIKHHRQIYSTYPEWIKIVNINHWQERTQMWYVYEITK